MRYSSLPLLSNRLRSVMSGLAVLTLAVAPGHAGDAPALKAPPWLDASLGVKESYDDNVFLSGVDTRFLPTTISVPSGSVAALKERSSWVTTVSPKIGVNVIPALNGGALQTASFAYAPEFAIYHDLESESYNAHRFMAAVKGGAGAWTFGADETFVFVDGNEFGPTYPGGLLNAYATAVARERREQIQDRATVNVRYDWPKFFVRAAAFGAFYDLMTEKINASGYQNYVDRYDLNGGADFGWKVIPKLAVTLGYRYGHQYQQQLDFSPYSASSDYQRLLAGIEGKPWTWLELKIQGGPDFRQYDENSATHITPLNDLQPIRYYVEAGATATFSPSDSVAFKLKQWQWVSSTGKVPYFDTAIELGYHRKCSDRFAFDLCGRYFSSDYTRGNLPACQRHDRDFAVSIGCTYVFNAHASANIGYSLDLGRNDFDHVKNAETRNFTRNIFSVGATFKL